MSTGPSARSRPLFLASSEAISRTWVELAVITRTTTLPARYAPLCHTEHCLADHMPFLVFDAISLTRGRSQIANNTDFTSDC